MNSMYLFTRKHVLLPARRHPFLLLGGSWLLGASMIVFDGMPSYVSWLLQLVAVVMLAAPAWDLFLAKPPQFSPSELEGILWHDYADQKITPWAPPAKTKLILSPNMMICRTSTPFDFPDKVFRAVDVSVVQVERYVPKVTSRSDVPMVNIVVRSTDSSSLLLSKICADVDYVADVFATAGFHVRKVGTLSQ